MQNKRITKVTENHLLFSRTLPFRYPDYLLKAKFWLLFSRLEIAPSKASTGTLDNSFLILTYILCFKYPGISQLTYCYWMVPGSLICLQ